MTGLKYFSISVFPWIVKHIHHGLLLRFWPVCLDNQVEGSIAIDGIKAHTERAHLRWFILSSKLRGSCAGDDKNLSIPQPCGPFPEWQLSLLCSLQNAYFQPQTNREMHLTNRHRFVIYPVKFRGYLTVLCQIRPGM